MRQIIISTTAVALVLTTFVWSTQPAAAYVTNRTRYCYATQPAQNPNFRAKTITTWDIYDFDNGYAAVDNMYISFEKRINGVWTAYNWGSQLRLNAIVNAVSRDQYGPVDPSTTTTWRPTMNYYDRANDIRANYLGAGYPGGVYTSIACYSPDTDI